MGISQSNSEGLDRVVDYLAHSQSLLFITGAGISADSGLPTYRGIGGLYNVNTTEEGLPIEEILSGHTMQTRPELAWKYLAEIGRAASGAAFNRGHEVIALMESRFDRVWTLTQNVDGFHRQAGSKHVIDVHGDMHDLCCPKCGFRQRVLEFDELEIPPRCEACGAILRPDVVLFGELLPAEKVQTLYRELEAGFDLVFTVGTTSVFPYIAEPVLRARMLGVPTVEINPGTSEVSEEVDVKLAQGAATALDAIWRRYEERIGQRPDRSA
ncbi:MAG: SIR2 family NAD-dependent protein deacylase [Planctomycetota bacterium]|jgi:NAD-dependent deacetylase